MQRPATASHRHKTRLAVAVVATVLGVALAANAAWTLTGTDLIGAHHQHALAATWHPTPTVEPATLNYDTVDPPHATPAPAPTTPDGAVARLEAPTISLDQFVVDGVTTEQLHRGPGRYTSTAVPGRDGTIAIAGHRTTYGAPFADLDLLAPGDPITVTPADGSPARTYLVTVTLIVDPADPTANDALTQVDGVNRLVLTTCHPKGSDRQRLIVIAEEAT